MPALWIILLISYNTEIKQELTESQLRLTMRGWASVTHNDRYSFNSKNKKSISDATWERTDNSELPLHLKRIVINIAPLTFYLAPSSGQRLWSDTTVFLWHCLFNDCLFITWSPCEAPWVYEFYFTLPKLQFVTSLELTITDKPKLVLSQGECI